MLCIHIVAHDRNTPKLPLTLPELFICPVQYIIYYDEKSF